ncbi:XRE family transcriptional regulator [Sphingomonas faeni]|uniref:XRE family transcriptional regulator n=1 Tax=Sphingomonas faeni TaxID=185950 RepID=UPI003349B861
MASDRQAREISAEIEAISHALSSEQVLKAVVEGLPQEVIEGVRRSLLTERRELAQTLEAYKSAKDGNVELLKRQAANDPGAMLIVARLAKGWPQKELARKLGLPEQQIQRYEAERYRGISLGSFMRFSRALDVQLSADIKIRSLAAWMPSYELSATDAQKVLKHARNNGWLKGGDTSDENAISQLKRHMAEHVGDHSTPSLLRTGLNVEDHTDDWVLLAWKAQVTRRAKAIIEQKKLRYRPINVSWLMDLVRLSSLDDGPSQAARLLEAHGIVMIVEPYVAGMKVDGAAFLVEDIPVIGLTLLRDRLDNFWFTLLHEVAHVILHYRTGLAAGFFDDVEHNHVDELEAEADLFASNLLIPEALWSRSPARIAKSAEPVLRLAKQLSISPAIIFGRIRKERRDYTIFSDKVGQGIIRKQLDRRDKEIMNV